MAKESPTSTELLMHTQKYVRNVFADRLLESGFVSRNGQDTHWYRVVNGELVNSVCFYTRSRDFPILLWMGYGIHPLFVSPFWSQSIYLNNPPTSFEILLRQPLLGGDSGRISYRYYSAETPVLVPSDESNGLFTLENIVLPKMNQVGTVDECYEMHKRLYASFHNCTTEQRWGSVSKEYIDEAIYVNDYEMFPYYQLAIERSLQNWRTISEKYPKRTDCAKQIRVAEYQHAAMFENRREEYLEYLMAQKTKTLNKLKKL